MEYRKPFFSIIIPTYNRASCLKRCLGSLENQIYKNFEAIICDDGSTDNSREVAESYMNKFDMVYVWNENWGGPARPRNNGLKLAKGEWICFLDSDDWWKPDKLSFCLSCLANNDLIYHNLEIRSAVSCHYKHKKTRSRSLKYNIKRDLLVNGNVIPNSSVIVRKSILDRVGPITENKEFIAIEDFDYWIRISEYTNRFLYIPKTLGYYWTGNQNISHGVRQIYREKALFDKYYKNLTISDQKAACNLLNYKIARIYHINMEYMIARKYYLNVLMSFKLKKYLFKSLLGYIFALLFVKK